MDKEEKVVQAMMMVKFVLCSSVLQVFQATIAWVRHEYPERRKYVYKLLRQVCLPMMMVMMVTSYSGTCSVHLPSSSSPSST